MEDNFTINFQLRRQRRKRKRLIRFLLLIFVGIITAYFSFNQFIKNKTNDSVNENIQVSSLENVVEETLAGTKGTYGIAIKNLKEGQSYYKNEHKIFEAGSLYKLWIMAEAFKQIQDGKLTEDQVLSEDVANLNQKFSIDPDFAELKEGTVSLTVRDALRQMITISHNYAALLLTEKIKLSSVATFLKTNGLTQSTVGTNGDAPTSTPSDIALFYEKLYKGELANQQYTEEMIDLLKSQQLDDGLPKYLPDKSKVAHKTGDIGWFKHDGGIVFTDKGDYIIVVMSESESPSGAEERISLVSKAIFDYFMLF